MRNSNLVGKRVRCEYMYDWIDSLGVPDKSAKALKGVEGTIVYVDDIGQIGVNWDNGSSLSLNPKTDKYTILN